MPQDLYTQVGPVRTRYWQAGDAGSPVLLIHGIACSVLEWQHNIDALAAQHRVFALDLLGFGLTDKPADETYTLSRLAQFVLDFMSAVGIDRAHIAGNSLGGRLALACAVIAPQRVASMVLADPAGMAERGTLFEFRLATLPVVGELFTRPSRFGTRMLWRKAFADPTPFVTDDLVSTKVALASLPGAQTTFLKTLRSFLRFRGFMPESVAELQAALPAIQASVLVIWGQQDRFVPVAHAEVLRRLLPNVRVELWDGCGHTPQVEMAERFNAAALMFWAEIDTRPDELPAASLSVGC